jgi:peptidyl-tRNA hydrolase
VSDPGTSAKEKNEPCLTADTHSSISAAAGGWNGSARWCSTGLVRRRKGSSGGHRGLESIGAALGSPDFARLRIGIGRPASQDPIEYVLDRFPASQREAVGRAVERAAEAVKCWASEGIESCMNRFN